MPRPLGSMTGVSGILGRPVKPGDDVRTSCLNILNLKKMGEGHPPAGDGLAHPGLSRPPSQKSPTRYGKWPPDQPRHDHFRSSPKPLAGGPPCPGVALLSGTTRAAPSVTVGSTGSATSSSRRFASAASCSRTSTNSPRRSQPIGASLDDVRRRLHATDEDGKLIVGADVAIAIWRITRGEAWLAKLFGNPVILPVTRFAYDRFADVLFAWNRWKGRW